MLRFLLVVAVLALVAGCNDRTPTETYKPVVVPPAADDSQPCGTTNPGDDDCPNKAQAAMRQLFAQHAFGDDDQPSLSPWQAELMVSICEAYAKENPYKAGATSMPRAYISILEDCNGIPACEAVHERVSKCEIMCPNGMQRYFHVLMEAEAGTYWHMCVDYQGNMGGCPQGTY